jgi:hypothetical protein
MFFCLSEVTLDLTYRYRHLIAVFAFLIACGQAWDSGVLDAPLLTQGLVAIAAVLVPVSIIVSGGALWTVIAIWGLLSAARMLSPVPLPTLHLAGLVPAFVLIARGLQRRQEPTRG